MKKAITILILAVILISGCNKMPSEPKVIGAEAECAKDDDCVMGGCSGTICQSRNAEPVYTTCVYLPEYECYKEIDCGCVNGKCEWEKTEGFNKCVEGKRRIG